MYNYKIWNSDLGKVFIERQNREVGNDIKKTMALGKGGQAIDKMINSPLNKEYNGIVKADRGIKKGKEINCSQCNTLLKWKGSDVYGQWKCPNNCRKPQETKKKIIKKEEMPEKLVEQQMEKNPSFLKRQRIKRLQEIREKMQLDPKDQDAVAAEIELGRGGQAIDKMLRSNVNKDYNGIVKPDR